MQLAVELGRELDIPIELGPLVEDIFRRFCDQGRGQEDQLEMMRDFMQRSGVDVPERKVIIVSLKPQSSISDIYWLM